MSLRLTATETKQPSFSEQSRFTPGQGGGANTERDCISHAEARDAAANWIERHLDQLEVEPIFQGEDVVGYNAGVRVAIDCNGDLADIELQ